MKQIRHLPIDGHQTMVVTIAAQRVGAVNSILKTLEGGRSLAHVAVGTAKKVVGAELLVGGAMTVVVLRGLKEQRVEAAGHRDIGTVQAVGPIEQGFHTLPPSVVAGNEQEQQQKCQ